MNKIYLAGGISDKARKDYQKKIAGKLEDLGYEVYAAATNDSINDKSNDPTPRDIYNADVSEILSSNYFIQTISGAGEDGTNYESGFVAGYNEAVTYYNKMFNNIISEIARNNHHKASEILEEVIHKEVIGIAAFTTNERIMKPQFHQGIPSAGYNHLILGGINKWGAFTGNEDDMLEVMEIIKGEEL